METVTEEERGSHLVLGLCDNRANNEKCSDSCNGELYVEGPVNGKYIPEEKIKNPGPYENGEYATDSMSVCTEDNRLFRVHWKDHPKFTLEPRCHLRNAPTHVNEAISKYNKTHVKKYKGRKAVVPNIKNINKSYIFEFFVIFFCFF